MTFKRALNRPRLPHLREEVRQELRGQRASCLPNSQRLPNHHEVFLQEPVPGEALGICLELLPHCFPCNARGEVDLNQLSEASLRDYLFGRVMMRLRCIDPVIIEVTLGYDHVRPIAAHGPV